MRSPGSFEAQGRFFTPLRSVQDDRLRENPPDSASIRPDRTDTSDESSILCHSEGPSSPPADDTETPY